MTATLNPALREFWETPARNRVLVGGRASSKSWDAAGVALFAAQAAPLKIMCTRQFQNRIDDSVYTLLNQRIGHFGFESKFEVQKTTIHSTMGSQFIFYGLWRHIEEIKSTEGVDILWIEESHNLTEEQWEILEPTIRKEGSQIWLIFNPKLATDFSYKRFVLNPPPDTIVRHINYDENPFLSQTMHRIIQAKKAEDKEEYDHIYGGQPRTDDDQVIIKRSWLLSCIGAAEKLGLNRDGKNRIGFDVADSGDDKNAWADMRGSILVDVEDWSGGEDELPKSARRVYDRAIQAGADISYDSIGVGAFVGGYVDELNELRGKSIKHMKFNAAAGVVDPEKRVDPENDKSEKNKDAYSNLKAQAWSMLGRRAQLTHRAVKGEIEIDPDTAFCIDPECTDVERLITELSSPRRQIAANGKMKVESKEDMKKRGIDSPNLADAVVAATAQLDKQGYDWLAAL